MQVTPFKKENKRQRKCGSIINLYYFVFLLCVNIFGKAIYFSYIIGTLTTIEKRFSLSSKKSGFILSCYDIGYIFSVILGTYIGERIHPTRSISLTTFLLTICMLIWTIPYLAFPNPFQDKALAGAANFTGDVDVEYCTIHDNSTEVCVPSDLKGNSAVAYWMFLFAHIICGLVGSIGFPLGCTYISNNCRKEQLSFYMGLVTSIYSGGEIFGFGVSSLTLSWYETPWLPVKINSSDQNWIGAWWMGYVLTAVIEGVTVIPFIFFPRKLNAAEDEENEALELTYYVKTTEREEIGLPQKELKKQHSASSGDGESTTSTNRPTSAKGMIIDFLWCCLKLVKNPVFLLYATANCAICWTLGGYGAFLPKYLEQYFARTASTANIITGTAVGAGACAGMLIGGGLVSIFKWGYKAQARVVAVTMFLSLLPCFVLMVITCEQGSISGYSGHFNGLLKKDDLGLSCNSNCSCVGSVYEPVCDEEGKQQFLTSCWAGCQTPLFDHKNDNKLVGFQNCTCAANESVTVGQCGVDCTFQFGLYVAVLASATFFAMFSQGPMMTLIFKSCSSAERSISLATLYATNSVIGWIPAPIVSGALIDSGCLLMQSECDDGSSESYCELYDNSNFRLKLHMLAAIAQLVAFIACVPVICFAGRIKDDENDEEEEKLKQAEEDEEDKKNGIVKLVDENENETKNKISYIA